mmetsp:Transcript_76537/g.151739  ORF Transcript_76537/g.151739 Transcript_76537/m.151739 type:complete len:210 (-) Transcript_76537:733-1362(-)
MIVDKAFSRSVKPLYSEVEANPLAAVSMCSEWPWPGVSLNRFAFVILVISESTRSCFFPSAPIKHRWCVVTCICPIELPSEHENLPNLSEPSGKLKFLISFSGSVLRSRLKFAIASLSPCVPTSLSSSPAFSCPGGFTSLNRLAVDTDEVRPNQRWLSASAAVMRLRGSTTSSLATKSFASAEMGSQYGARNLYEPDLIFLNICASLSP